MSNTKVLQAGRVAIVTGASSGLGRATALRLANAEMGLVVTARRPDKLAELAGEIKAQGGTCLTVAGDAAELLVAEQCVALALEKFGRIDVLVNNAGSGLYKQFLGTSLEEFDAMMRSNVRSGFAFSRCVAPHLVAQRSGDIVFVSSVAGLVGASNESAYCTSKFAQVGLAQALAEELHPFGVKVCILCPGGMKTEFALGQGRTPEDIAHSTMMDPEETAAAVLFACTQPPNLRITQMTVRHMGRQHKS